MRRMFQLWQMLLSITCLMKNSNSSTHEGIQSKIEMHAGETNVTVLTADTIDAFLNSDRPAFISFTKETCRICTQTEYQLIILADNYKRQKIDVDIGVICIKDHAKIGHKYHVNDIPDIRLYYKGMYKKYLLGDDFSLMNRWIEGQIHFKDAIDFSNPDRFYDKMIYRRHGLIWYGDNFKQLDSKRQELLRRLYFKFTHDFHVFTTDSDNIGKKFNLEKNNLYEWNSYDKLFRKVPTQHIYNEEEFTDQMFHKIADFIKFNSYRKLTKYNPEWMRAHHTASPIIFYIRKNHTHSPLDNQNYAIFNQTCIDYLHEKTHCLYYDHEGNELHDLDYIFQVPLTHIADTAIIYTRSYLHWREVYVHNLTNYQNEENHAKKLEITLTEQFLDDFYHKASATPSHIKPYWTKNQKLHPENHKKVIHEMNTQIMHHFFHDHTHDLCVFLYNSTDYRSHKSMDRFVKAVKYVLKMSSKRPRIRFGTLDCEQNECQHSLKLGSDLPIFAYFKAWEYTRPNMVDIHMLDEDGAFPIGHMVQLIHFQYSDSKREILRHDDHFKDGKARHGPGEAYLHEYDLYKHYHDHSLKEHMQSGELHEEAKVPYWPHNSEHLIEHHDNVDFNFNFDL